MKKITIAAIAAMDEIRVIGVDNTIPWRYPQDMKHFAELTTGHTVLMGHKTYHSLPPKFRPLPNRLNIVAGRSITAEDFPSGVKVCNDLIGYLNDVKEGRTSIQGDYLWIIGGAQIYQLTLPFWEEAFITLVPASHKGDAFFPHFEDSFKVVQKQSAPENLTFLKYKRK